MLTAGAMMLTTAAIAGGADAPLGYQLMCLQNPAECKSTGASKAIGKNATLATLVKINNTINKKMTPKHDVAGLDQWSANAQSGDCEDFALAKRVALIKLGFPSASLHIAYGKRNGEPHAVLVANIKGGKYVLDMPGIEKKVKPISATPYKHWRTL